MGDNRIEKNLYEGASKCSYAIAILSKNTIDSICAMEELSIIEDRCNQKDVTVFPVLYELLPECIPIELQWIKSLIFKEVNRHSGTREICNHIACKITGDILDNCNYKSIQDILNVDHRLLPSATYAILSSYQEIDCANLNSRVSLLYAAYLTIIHTKIIPYNSLITMISKIFERLLSEMRLNLTIDYRDLWLLENSICILVDCYLVSCIESRI